MSPKPPPANFSLAPDPTPLVEARDAVQQCIDLIEADGPKGGMWGQTFNYSLLRAIEKCQTAFGTRMLS